MICHLIRHGKDDDSVRGGWSASPLTDTGVAQVERLAAQIASDSTADIGMIFTSDPVREMPAFREANNGELAGMSNTVAAEQYPGLYWNMLEWDQPYPGGESPHDFFDRIQNAWYVFRTDIRQLDCDVILVTHGGVIQVIHCIENGIPYSNKEKPYPIGHVEMLDIEMVADSLPKH